MSIGRLDDQPTGALGALREVERQLSHILVETEGKLLNQQLERDPYLREFARRKALTEVVDLLEREMRKWGIEPRVDRHRWRAPPKPERGALK